MVNESRRVVSFAELAAGDQLVIETVRSTYTFSMSDPAQRLGELDGGCLGEPQAAYAVGAVTAEQAFWKGGVRVGDRAVFLSPILRSNDTSARLVTSQVVRIRVLWREPRAA